MIDHRELLKKYIDHVGNCEGTDFLNIGYRGGNPEFTDEEWAELVRLRDEIEPGDTSS
jgi:hypothetical protein